MNDIRESAAMTTARDLLDLAIRAYRREPAILETLQSHRVRLDEPLRVALVGSVKAGKSTLLNALLGEQRQATRAIRATDDRGRHTTVRRELLRLPGGALAIDTPGLRLVAPLEDGDAAVPLLDKAQVKRDRRARERAFHRQHYREMRERKRAREASDRRRG
jgi:ribosome biogenesis GTPase